MSNHSVASDRFDEAKYYQDGDRQHPVRISTKNKYDMVRIMFIQNK